MACDTVHERLRAVWREATSWRVGRYVLMPDHVHVFAGQVDVACELETWVKYWKSLSMKGRPGLPGRWQTSHWDRRLRPGESYARSWEFVLANPVRAGLVSSADQWPYAGELFELQWD